MCDSSDSAHVDDKAQDAKKQRQTMASTTGSSHGKGVETAVPTLKVMRLQSPDLSQVRFYEVYMAHSLQTQRSSFSSVFQPIAGSLDSKCLLSSSLALPDSFGGRYLILLFMRWFVLS